MSRVNLYINLDFFPPKAERLFQTADLAAENHVENIYLNITGNFPWEFDSRMRSEAYIPDSVLKHFCGICRSRGLAIYLSFPRQGDYTGLLRLPSYRRFVSSEHEKLSISGKAAGLNSFLESVFDDMSSLLPEIGGFFLRGPDERSYSEYVRACADRMGHLFLECDEDFLFVEEYFNASGKSGLPAVYQRYVEANAAFSLAVFNLKQYAVMSSLCCGSPASAMYSAAELYDGLVGLYDDLQTETGALEGEASGLVDDGWMGRFIDSAALTAEEDFHSVERRFRQLGFLRRT